MPATDTHQGVAGTTDPVSASQAFSKQQRLRVPREFKAVFDGASRKASHRHLLLLAVPHEGKSARLGIVVGKKHAKLAVQRNRLKRLLRESFRQHQQVLAGLDIVALAKPGLWQQDNAAIRALIDSQWQRLLRPPTPRAEP